MGVTVHALPSEAFGEETDLMPFAKLLAATCQSCAILAITPVDETRLTHLEKLIATQGLKVKRMLIQLASEMSDAKIECFEPTVFVCECFGETISASAGAHIACAVSDSDLVLWSNSDFLRTADFSYASSAEIIPSLNYGEALELFSFMKKSSLGPALQPAMNLGIHISVRCLKQVEEKGTLIAPAKALGKFTGVKCICSMDDMTIISVEQCDRELCERVFSVLKKAGIEIQFLARASGDSSMTFAVSGDQASACRLAVRGLFSSTDAATWVKSQNNCAIVSALGEGMAKMSGMCGQFFGALGVAQINVKAFAQGLYERSICAVIGAEQKPKALRALNASFFGKSQIQVQPEIKSHKELFLGVFGIGNIGTELLKRIKSFNEKGDGRNIVVCFVANSRRCLIDFGGIDLNHWRERFESESIEKDDEFLMESLAGLRQRHMTAVVDCTASPAVPKLYPHLMSRGVSVAAANKLGVCIDQKSFDLLLSHAKETRCHFGFEATVGAGLPVIRTIKDLASSGERIDRTEGSLSGTLSWIFYCLASGEKFSVLVKKAVSLGFCEPDPRADLCGADAGRKAAILSHYICPGKSFDDVVIEPLFPESMASVSKEEFLEMLPSLDAKFAGLQQQATLENKTLRYISTVTGDGQLHCGLKMVDITSPLASGTEGDCAVVIYTERYVDGLAIVGKGAGAGVTGNALMADICRIME